jgi:hypothetical protein
LLPLAGVDLPPCNAEHGQHCQKARCLEPSVVQADGYLRWPRQRMVGRKKVKHFLTLTA